VGSTPSDPHDVVEKYDPRFDRFGDGMSPVELWTRSIRSGRCVVCKQVGISIDHFLGHFEDLIDEMNVDQKRPPEKRLHISPALRERLFEIELQVEQIRALSEIRDELCLLRREGVLARGQEDFTGWLDLTIREAVANQFEDQPALRRRKKSVAKRVAMELAEERSFWPKDEKDGKGSS